MTLSYKTDLRNAKLDTITSAIGNAGIIKIYSGTVPANVGVVLTDQLLLSQLVCGTPFANASSNGLLTANSITTEISADGSGAASFFRITTSAGVAIVQGSCGTSNADLIFNNADIMIGSTVAITSLTITEGNA